MNADIVYLNGQYLPADEARVSVFDRGFLFSDSVYEVIPFYRGQGFRLEQHLARLENSLRMIALDVNHPWEAILSELISRNGGGNLSAYLQVTRGSAGRRSVAYEADLQPTVFACCSPIKDIYAAGPEQQVEYRVIVTEDQRWRRCDIKATGLLPNILAQQQARQVGADEALLMRDGRLMEGASSNLFIVRDGVIFTPSMSYGILGGTTRELVIELALEHQLSLQETDFGYTELIQADEVWITSSTRGVVPVIEVDSQMIGQGNKGPIWRKMFDYFTRQQRELMAGEGRV
ncbi:aminotransferase class IV [Nitrincola sp. MINF-07-Sa-05]|uniref:aminotransferase class IV n=1 Tax=Nitrincola salilacus TaxID=3400273 RepID=UPI003917E4DF